MNRRLFLKIVKCTRSIRRRTTVAAASDGTVELSFESFEQIDKPHNKPPVIIMHGLMGSSTNWYSISKAISRTGRKVIAVDARNHGESPHTDAMDYHLMSKDVIRLMDDLNEEKATLIGHSMGGKAFMTMALEHPERVHSLMVVDVSPNPSPRANDDFQSYLHTMLKVQSRLSSDFSSKFPLSEARRSADVLLQEVEPDASVRQFLTTNIVFRNNKYQWRMNLDAIINNFVAITGFPEFTIGIGSVLPYAGPTLFIGGQNSNYITQKDQEAIDRLFPRSSIQYVDGAGHWVHAEKPKIFLQIVKQFLADH